MNSINDQRDLIGQVLLDIGYISPDQLAEAGVRQKNCPGKRLGEILIELGYISQARLKKGLVLQEMEREFKQRKGQVKKSS
jgi:hypothetical protein